VENKENLDNLNSVDPSLTDRVPLERVEEAALQEEIAETDASSGGQVREHPKASRRWSKEDAIEFYHIDGWGSGYFSVNAEGNLIMLPRGEGGPSIQLMDILDDIQKQNIQLPCIIRFQDILRDRVIRLNETFARVIQETSYKGHYRGVYPVKVNQLREVIEEIVDAGAPYHYGLEAGSKAELQIVLAYNTDPEAITICNGYKDSDFIRLALLGRQLDRKVMVVIEQFNELALTMGMAKEVGVLPMVGFRIKLATRGSGKWESSGGDAAKFGLSVAEITQGIQSLDANGMLEGLKLLHFHIGSQLTDIRTVKEAVIEGTRVYVEMRKRGAPVEYIDLGGGLGVDYDGSQSNSDYSMNYSVEEYIQTCIKTIQQICDEEGQPHPHIVTESGRAITAHHSCLIMNVVGSIASLPVKDIHKSLNLENSEIAAEVDKIIKDITPRTALTSYHDMVAKREEALNLFKLGLVSLDERAYIDEKFKELRFWLLKNRKRMKRIPEELENVLESSATQYLVNFSVFQSAPDHWAFNQLFPIVPIHRLTELPKRSTTLVDITCDSDGMIDRFIARKEAYDSNLWLHHLNGKPYYLGMFLTGAYQDIMGDLHNLFGRVNEVHVFCDDDDPEDFYIQEVIPGDTIHSVLEENQYVPFELSKFVRTAIEDKVKGGKIKPRDGVQMIDFYDRVMQGYTYLRS
jgi:arginine decarboxylase